MTGYVELQPKGNRGWPWPKDSWGLTPMFGEDGWCHSCGVPKGPQTGALVLQGKGMRVEGGWGPNWQFDVICLEAAVAEKAAAHFDLDLRTVEWRGTAPGEAFQIVIPTVGDAWFDPDELHQKAIEMHGMAGARCAECGTWRWMPLSLAAAPPLRITPALGDVPIAASPEWFGDGWNAYRQVLVRRDLAEFLDSACPRDFRIEELA